MKLFVALAILALAVVPQASVAESTAPYAAPKQTDKPILILIHGGGWATNTSAQTAPWASYLQIRGWPVVNAFYRLTCAQAGCPTADKLVLDVSRAARWARQHHADLGTSSRRVIAVGFSAGGQLAALLAARGIADGVVAFSAPTTLTSSAVSEDLAPYAEQFVGCSYAACASKWRSLSPSAYRSTRPMFLAYGQHEAMVPPLNNPMRLDPDARIVLVPGAQHSGADLAGGWERPLLARGLAYVTDQLDARGGHAR